MSSVVPSSRKRGIFQRKYTGPATALPSEPSELAADELVTGAAELEDELDTTGALLVCEEVDEATDEVELDELDELETGSVLLGTEPAGASSILNQLML